LVERRSGDRSVDVADLPERALSVVGPHHDSDDRFEPARRRARALNLDAVVAAQRFQAAGPISALVVVAIVSGAESLRAAERNRQSCTTHSSHARLLDVMASAFKGAKHPEKPHCRLSRAIAPSPAGDLD